ncbi:PIN domain-containing protein [Hathewaya proteolytica DSM 3090]|uniref:PIN domain-containing protein n=1 Tax=Hathewaya proteolytica DSM 3090 TaxID=1121331 RepID=A0A1M6RPG0_9CLOT|nr:type II toxin-antitoxin system VapC family toxin [Hathewaya proteolytica]SHK34335.1 PIN domain-containing protein [Hathewaya proteolytica DSM 3090]
MNIIDYPFDPNRILLGSSVMLDTCFILTLLYDTDPKNMESCNTLSLLRRNNCSLYVNDMTIAETINQITKKLFINDMKYKIDRIQPLNSINDIEIILSCFNKRDRKLIKERRLEYYKEIPFNKYFHNIAKNPWKKDLLKIYFTTSVDIFSYFEKVLNLKFVSITHTDVILSKLFITKYMLSINDAFHLSSAISHDITYFLTLDKDFDTAIEANINILKI